MINRYSKILFCVLIAIVFNSKIQVFSQTNVDNLKKYWHYRDRLKKGFLRVGDCDGCSIPATERFQNGELKWGDATIRLGQYIAVLATEYKLLHDNAEDIDETARELYYALNAFNRLDYNCEKYFDVNGPIYPGTGTTDLNGFFMRDDVSSEDVIKSMGDLNSSIFRTTITSFDSDFKIRTALKEYGNTGTIDQLFDVMMGCAFVVKCVPTTAGYGGMNFVQEAKNITDRMLTWLNKDGDFAIKNPVTGNCLVGSAGSCADKYDPENCRFDISCGSATTVLSYATAVSGKKITGNYYQNAYSLSTEIPWQLLQDASMFGVSFPLQTTEITKFLTLASMSNSFYQYGFDPLQCFVGFVENVYDLFSAQDHTLANECIHLYPTNTTAQSVLEMSQFVDKELYPLMHGILQGHQPDKIKPDVINLLNSAPCEGPYNFGNNDDGGYEWSVPDRWRDSEMRGALDPEYYGEYNGLDYMMLHNFYYILYGSELPKYQNLMDNNLTHNYPWNISLFNGSVNYVLGSKDNPIDVGGFNTLTANNTLNAVSGSTSETAQVTYRAGREVKLEPGFTVQRGAEFLAYTQPYSCNSAGEYERPDVDESLYGMDVPYEPNNYVPLTYYNSDSVYVSNDTLGVNSTTVSYKKENTTLSTNDDELLDEVNKKMQFSLYPNPTHDAFTLYNEGPSGYWQVTVNDIQGRKIYVVGTNQNALKITTDNWNKGMYFVELQQGNMTQRKRVIVQ